MNNDTISRQEAIDILTRMSTDHFYGHRPMEAFRLGAEALSAERHGRWEDVEPAPHNLFYATCSVCGERQTIEVANFCPMCGAKMDEEVTK